VSWTATGLLPCIIEGTDLPLTAVFYSKYSSSGSVVSGYDKETVAIGFNSEVATDSNSNMIIVWNTFDIFTLKTRIMAEIYTATAESSSKAPFEVAVRSDYDPSNLVDTDNYFLIRGMDVSADSEGNFFITWGGSNIGSEHIYLKPIYSDGSSLTSDIQVSQGFDLNYDPAIAVDSQGNIIITWNKFTLANLLTGAESIYARRYDNNLRPLGDEFKVNVVY